MDYHKEIKQLEALQLELQKVSMPVAAVLSELLAQRDLKIMLGNARLVVESLLKELCRAIKFEQSEENYLDCDNLMVGKLIAALSKQKIAPKSILTAMNKVNELAISAHHPEKVFYPIYTRTALQKLNTILKWYIFEYYQLPLPPDKKKRKAARLFIAAGLGAALITLTWREIFPENNSGVSNVRTTLDCSLDSADKLIEKACSEMRFDGSPACDESRLRDVLKICPEHPEANSNLAELLEQQGELEQAINHYQIALKAANNQFNAAWYGLGNVYLRQGQPGAALAAYAHACGGKDAYHANKARTEVRKLLAQAISPPESSAAELKKLLPGCLAEE